MRWGDSKRDHDLILAVWPTYRALFRAWVLEELAERAEQPPAWRVRRIPTPSGHVKPDVYRDKDAALEAAEKTNVVLLQEIESRDLGLEAKTSVRLKATKSIQARRRLFYEEDLMEQAAIARGKRLSPAIESSLVLPVDAEPFRAQLFEQLLAMPYLKLALVWGSSAQVLTRKSEYEWGSPNRASERTAQIAWRARIANGFDLSATQHWGETKAKIRQILLPRANKLLQLASVRKLLDEAYRHGQRVLVANGFVFWYEAEGDIGWQIKETGSPGRVGTDAETLWEEGEILSTNHGRIVVLPYIKESGEHVTGHTRNGPRDGPALPRHPENYLRLPFHVLHDDLMIKLYGELPYE